MMLQGRGGGHPPIAVDVEASSRCQSRAQCCIAGRTLYQPGATPPPAGPTRRVCVGGRPTGFGADGPPQAPGRHSGRMSGRNSDRTPARIRWIAEGATLLPAGASRGLHAAPRAACRITWALRLHPLVAPVSGPGSFYYRLPGATARVASTLIDSVLAAPGTWPRLAARLYRPPGATAAYSQTSSSRCTGAPYGGPCPDCVVDGRDPTGPGSTRHVTTPPERLA